MIQTFRDSIQDSRNLRILHHHCKVELSLPGEFGDLLRMGHVYCLSALDKFVHDLVTHHMVEVFVGRRPPTQKYLSETISLQGFADLTNASVPPAEIVFQGLVRAKLAHQSFMDPGKLVDALSLVWDEKHKWQAIATDMGRDRNQVVTELRNLFMRRNAIVHEADRDPSTGQKMPILPADVERAENFVLSLGESINRLL